MKCSNSAGANTGQHRAFSLKSVWCFQLGVHYVNGQPNLNLCRQSWRSSRIRGYFPPYFVSSQSALRAFLDPRQLFSWSKSGKSRVMLERELRYGRRWPWMISSPPGPNPPLFLPLPSLPPSKMLLLHLVLLLEAGLAGWHSLESCLAHE